VGEGSRQSPSPADTMLRLPSRDRHRHRSARSKTVGGAGHITPVLTWDTLSGAGPAPAPLSSSSPTAAAWWEAVDEAPSERRGSAGTLGVVDPQLSPPTATPLGHASSEGDLAQIDGDFVPATLFHLPPDTFLRDPGAAAAAAAEPALSSRQAGTRSRNRSRGRKTKRDAAAAAAVWATATGADAPTLGPEALAPHADPRVVRSPSLGSVGSDELP
jgi:hypothetical protein